MPYIATERVKIIRDRIKKEFPEYKISVRRHHGSSVDIAIMEAPIELRMDPSRDDESVNIYYIKDHYKGEAADVLLRIKEIAETWQRELVNDGDYGSVPTYYVHINVGNWEKPFKIK